MKRNLFYAFAFLAASAAVLSSCEKKVSVEPSYDKDRIEMSFVCSKNSDVAKDSELRVSVDSDNGNAIWESSDKIVIMNDQNELFEFYLTDGAGTDTGYFTGSIVPSENDTYYGFYLSDYEYKSIGTGKISITIPSVLHYSNDFFGRCIPFAGKAENNRISFYPTFSLFRFGVKGKGSINKVVLKGKESDVMSGDFVIDCTNLKPVATFESYANNHLTYLFDSPVTLNSVSDTFFTFVVPVGNFSSGFDLTFYDTEGNTSVVNTDKSNVLGYSDLKYIDGLELVFLKNYLTFESKADGSSVSLVKTGNPNAVNLLYTVDDVHWNEYVIGNSIVLNNGDHIRFKGDNSTFSIDDLNYYNFVISGHVESRGSVMSLVYSELNSNTIPCDYCFYGLFKDCKGLFTPPEFDAVNLKSCCYTNCFFDCENLIYPPKLPSVVLPDGKKRLRGVGFDGVYSFMFYSCKNLLYTPELPAKNLGSFCYQGMFQGCTSLKSIQRFDFGDVPDGALDKDPSGVYENLAFGTCANMFYGCSNITDVPYISFSYAGSYAFSFMFGECRGLNKAVINSSGDSKTQSMYCFFNNCSNLSDITVSHTNWGKYGDNFAWWMYGVKSKGTFHCPQALIDNTTKRDYNTIPAKWIVDAY